MHVCKDRARPCPCLALPPQVGIDQAHSSQHLPCDTWSQLHIDPKNGSCAPWHWDEQWDGDAVCRRCLFSIPSPGLGSDSCLGKELDQLCLTASCRNGSKCTLNSPKRGWAGEEAELWLGRGSSVLWGNFLRFLIITGN